MRFVTLLAILTATDAANPVHVNCGSGKCVNGLLYCGAALSELGKFIHFFSGVIVAFV